MTRPVASLRHAGAALLFVGMAVAWTWPLVRHLASDIPGTPGDNLAFLWNDWWMRTALAAHTSPFRSELLFAPLGIDLSLHTHTALSSWLGATILARLPIVTAHNLLIVAVLAANGLSAYTLAWSRTRDWLAAMVAGVIFAGSPYLAAHLVGHVNLLSAWGIPLFTLGLLHTVERGSWRAAFGAGLVVVLAGFNDYYYVVYCAAIAAAILLHAHLHVEWTRHAARPLWRNVLLGLLAVDVALILAVVASGGFNTSIFGVPIAANRPTNLLAAGWVLLALLALARVRPRLRWRPATERGVLPSRALALTALVAIVGLYPLWSRAVGLMMAGDYTAPGSSWRSGPSGVDLATLVLGNPWHGWIGPAVRDIYHHLHVDVVESVGWMGIAPLGLASLALARARTDRDVRLWRWICAVFFVWALGPWLKVAGLDTGLLLPQNVLAHLPIVSNARMPGRAMVVVFMALALLAAHAIARADIGRRPQWAIAALVIVALDFLPAPFPLTPLQTPALYETLRDLPPGTVCELPVGVRDGFSSQGLLDDRVLAYQMTHGHPLVGGFAARVPASVRAAYATMPVVRSLLLLSEGKDADASDLAITPESAGAALRQASIAYVVLNRETAPAALATYATTVLPLRLVAREGARDLFVVQQGAP